MYRYNIKDLEPYIVGYYSLSDYFYFTMYSDKAPSDGDSVMIDGKIFRVISTTDCTTDEEYDEGLSYTKIYLELEIE